MSVEQPTTVGVDGMDTLTGQLLAARLLTLSYEVRASAQVLVLATEPEALRGLSIFAGVPIFQWVEGYPVLDLDFHFEVEDAVIQIHPLALRLVNSGVPVEAFVDFVIGAWGLRRSDRWKYGSPFRVTVEALDQWNLVERVKLAWR